MFLIHSPPIAPLCGANCVGINCEVQQRHGSIALVFTASKGARYSELLNHSVDYVFCLCHQFENYWFSLNRGCV